MSKITKKKLISRNFINVEGGNKKAGSGPSIGVSSSVVRSLKTFVNHQTNIPTRLISIQNPTTPNPTTPNPTPNQDDNQNQDQILNPNPNDNNESPPVFQL